MIANGVAARHSRPGRPRPTASAHRMLGRLAKPTSTSLMWTTATPWPSRQRPPCGSTIFLMPSKQAETGAPVLARSLSAHDLKVVGSNPAPVTRSNLRLCRPVCATLSTADGPSRLIVLNSGTKAVLERNCLPKASRLWRARRSVRRARA